MACLFITEGPAKGQIFALESHPLVLIGRDDECSFQILDERVSRRHLQIKRDEKEARHYAVDFESANGVQVNGKRIDGTVALTEGDIIQIGRTSIVYSVKEFPDAQTARDAWFKKGQAQQKTMLPPEE